jgi:lipoprotein-releasing system permease protein
MIPNKINDYKTYRATIFTQFACRFRYFSDNSASIRYEDHCMPAVPTLHQITNTLCQLLHLNPLAVHIGWRYAWQHRRRSRKNKLVQSSHHNGFLPFISRVSMIGIGLGIAALIVVMSVMNGFQREVRDRMLAMISHIEVMVIANANTNINTDINTNTATFDQAHVLQAWQTLQHTLMQQPEVIGSAPFVAGQGLLMLEDSFSGVMVRGVDPAQEGRVSDLPNLVKQGSWQSLNTQRFGVLIGKDLAQRYQLKIGDALPLMIPAGEVTPAGMVPRTKTLRVAGVFESGHSDYDSNVILLHLNDAMKLYRLNLPTGLRLKLNDAQIAPRVAQQLDQRINQDTHVPFTVSVHDWSQQNRNWFAAVKTEKRMMFIILTLIIAVAAFNMVSMLMMTVMEKRPQIAILKTMGMSSTHIAQIFIVQGMTLGVIGTLGGIASGVLLALNLETIVAQIEQLFHIEFLPKDIYLISALPSHVEWLDVTWIGGISLALSLCATIYPSIKAAGVLPATVLRGE